MNETSPIIKEKAPLILAEIKKAKSILLHCHPSPDTDSIGSALAMKFALEQMGKKAVVIKGDSEIHVAFKHFPGANEIVQKNFFEIDLKEFDLFIIVDTGNMEMVSGKKKVEFPKELRTIVIDHHFSNNGYGDIDLIDKSAPATAFILFQLFFEWEINITKPIALNLMLGMYSDTGGFKYEQTDYRLLQAAAYCAKIAPDYTESIFLLENSEPKEAIYFKSLALNSIETFCNDKVAISSVSYSDLKAKQIPIHVVSGSEIANLLKSVIGWDIGVLMTEVEPGRIKMGFRTRDSEKYDVSKIAVAFGGGGHKSASGADSKLSLNNTKELVVEKIKSLYNL